ncbi:MAG TPA: sialate O-acetylesterase, partial [Povalibacter sp.]
DVPLTSITAPVTWSPVAPESIREFAATCYFFGRDLHKANGVPQGLIHSSWGGSIIQAWTSATALRELKSYDSTLQLMQLHARNPAVAESQWKQSQQRWWEQHDPNQKRWSSIDADDAGWPAVRPRDFWEKSGIAAFNEFDGIVWFRTSVVLSDKQANQPASLSLGPVDDVDETWVNGRRIGSMEGWNVQRDYQIPKGVLRSGRNVIAVGVLDSGGGGGLWGEPSQRKLQLASGEAVSLDAEWRYQVSGSLTQVGAAPSAPWMTAVGTTTLYNAMIAPLAGYTLRGVAWYQGESNAMEAEEYARLLPLMMKDWRNAFGNDLPFLVVQLAAFGAAANSPSESPWAELRETQRRVVNADGNAALATAVDIGDRFDIHPTNKQEVGRRLALAARRLVFHENIAAAGPEAMTARRDGAKVIIGFANAGGGLQVNGGNRPAGFELCDSSRQCSFVDAAVEQDRVVLEASAVPGAVKVRYAWAKSPVCNLYNQQQLPALPFEMSIQ